MFGSEMEKRSDTANIFMFFFSLAVLISSLYTHKLALSCAISTVLKAECKANLLALCYVQCAKGNMIKELC